MEFLRYTYSPKVQSIVCTQVHRQEGFSRSSVHMHDHHELVLVTSQAVCRIINNGNPVEVAAPCVILNRAGSFHEVVEVCCGDYDSQVVFFHPQVLSRLPEEMLFEKQLFSADLTAVSLTQDQLKRLEPLFSMLCHRPYTQQLPLLLTVFAAMAQLLQEGTALVRSTAADNYIFDVIELLQNQQQAVTLSQLARQFHVCQTKLKADFKRITGLPVMTYKNHLRLEKAKILLDSTDETQARIAYTCGFSDESYFIRTFRKQFGMTPAAYRKRK